MDGASEGKDNAQRLQQVLWRESAEYKRIVRWRMPLLLFATLLFFGMVVAYIIGEDTFVRAIGPEKQAAIALLVSAVAVLPMYFYILSLNASRKMFMDRVQVGLVVRLQDEEKQLSLDANGKPDFASLWAVTQKRIDLYHSIATEQADTSFRMGRRATIGGFVAVLTLGGFAAFAKDGSAAIAASVVGVAGAAMTGYIGATFMKSQSEASAQLSQFFLQPVEFSRMLGVERLLDSLQPPDRARAIQRIVDSAMPATTLTPVEETPEPKPATLPAFRPGLWKRIRTAISGSSTEARQA